MKASAINPKLLKSFFLFQNLITDMNVSSFNLKYNEEFWFDNEFTFFLGGGV